MDFKYTFCIILLILFLENDSIQGFRELKTFLSELDQCKWTKVGFEYIGKTNKSSKGSCINWSSIRIPDSKFPEKNTGRAKNYCRNPDLDHNGPWCYINKQANWEYCQIKKCKFDWNECQQTKVKLNYHGSIMDKECQTYCRNTLDPKGKNPTCIMKNQKRHKCDIPKCEQVTQLSQLLNVPDHTFNIDSKVTVKEFDNYKFEAEVIVEIDVPKHLVTNDVISRMNTFWTTYRTSCQTDFNYHQFCDLIPDSGQHTTDKYLRITYKCKGVIRSILIVSPLDNKKYSVNYNFMKIDELEQNSYISLYNDYKLKAEAIYSRLSQAPNVYKHVPKYSGCFFLIEPNVFSVLKTEKECTIGLVSVINHTNVGFIGSDSYFLKTEHYMLKNLYKLVYGTTNTIPVMLDKTSIDVLYNDMSRIQYNNYVWSTHNSIGKDRVNKLIKLIKSGLKLIIYIKPWAYNDYNTKLMESELKQLFILCGFWPRLNYDSTPIQEITSVDLNYLPLSVKLAYAEQSIEKSQEIYKSFVSSKLSKEVLDLYINNSNSQLSMNAFKYYKTFNNFIKAYHPCYKLSSITEPIKSVYSIMNYLLLTQARFPDVPYVNMFPSYGHWNSDDLYIHRMTLAIQVKNEQYITGYYAKPQSKITLKINSKTGKNNCYLSMNYVFDNIVSRDFLYRWSKVYRKYNLKFNEDNVIYTNLGGIITVSCEKPKDEINLVFTNVYELAMYDKTNNINNIDSLRSKSPWVIMGTDMVIFILPIISVRNIRNYQNHLDIFDKVIRAFYVMGDRTIQNDKREIIAADFETNAGYMHSGYPIAVHMFSAGNPNNKVDFLFDQEIIKKKGLWGIFHELGHNMERGFYKDKCFDEIINNIYTVLSTEMTSNSPTWNPKKGWLGILNRDKNIINYIRYGKFSTGWCGKFFVALGTFIQLQNEFGWDFYRNLFKRLKEMENLVVNKLAQAPKNKFDLWIVESSRIANFNLIGYFDFWKWPITSETKKQLNELKLKRYYMPNDWLTKKFTTKIWSIMKKYRIKNLYRRNTVNKNNFFDVVKSESSKLYHPMVILSKSKERI